MTSNISPHVRAMLAKRTGGADAASAAPISLKPEQVRRVTPPVADPFAGPQTVFPEPGPVADDDDGLPEGQAVQADPENDNPPEPPTDGSYGYQEDVVITPDRAQHLVDLHPENQRRRKESSITRFARDMRRGKWKSRTGETIKVSASGLLIDGQNRMHAVIRAQSVVVFDIAWNVPDDRMLVIDGNSPRTTSDDFRIKGVADRFLGGALVRWVLAWEKGNYLAHGGRLTPTRSEVQERYEAEPTSFDQAAMFGRAAHHRIKAVNATAAAMAYFLFAKMPDGGQEMAEKFFESFIGGLELSAGSPVAALRDRMTASRGRDFNRNEQLALLIKAWNAYRTGRTTASGRIVVGKERLTNDRFPMPV